MDRRAFIASVGLAGAGLSTGCLARAPGGTEEIVGRVRDRTRFQGWTPAYSAKGSPVTDPGDGEHVAVNELEYEPQREILNAIAQEAYYSWKTPALLDEDLHLKTVHFRNGRLSLGVSVSDYGELPEGWESPIEVTAHRSSDDLRIAIENRTSEPIELLARGAPALGVLVATAPSDSVFLEHEEYRSHHHIVTSGEFAYTEPEPIYDSVGETIGPTETFETTYGVPQELTPDHEIRLQQFIRVHDDAYTNESRNRKMVDLVIDELA